MSVLTLLILQSMNKKKNAAIWLFSKTLTLAKKKKVGLAAIFFFKMLNTIQFSFLP